VTRPRQALIGWSVAPVRRQLIGFGLYIANILSVALVIPAKRNFGLLSSWFESWVDVYTENPDLRRAQENAMAGLRSRDRELFSTIADLNSKVDRLFKDSLAQFKLLPDNPTHRKLCPSPYSEREAKRQSSTTYPRSSVWERLLWRTDYVAVCKSRTLESLKYTNFVNAEIVKELEDQVEIREHEYCDIKFRLARLEPPKYVTFNPQPRQPRPQPQGRLPQPRQSFTRCPLLGFRRPGFADGNFGVSPAYAQPINDVSLRTPARKILGIDPRLSLGLSPMPRFPDIDDDPIIMDLHPVGDIAMANTSVTNPTVSFPPPAHPKVNCRSKAMSRVSQAQLGVEVKRRRRLRFKLLRRNREKAARAVEVRRKLHAAVMIRIGLEYNGPHDYNFAQYMWCHVQGRESWFLSLDRRSTRFYVLARKCAYDANTEKMVLLRKLAQYTGFQFHTWHVDIFSKLLSQDIKKLLTLDVSSITKFLADMAQSVIDLRGVSHTGAPQAAVTDTTTATSKESSSTHEVAPKQERSLEEEVTDEAMPTVQGHTTVEDTTVEDNRTHEVAPDQKTPLEKEVTDEAMPTVQGHTTVEDNRIHKVAPDQKTPLEEEVTDEAMPTVQDHTSVEDTAVEDGCVDESSEVSGSDGNGLGAGFDGKEQSIDKEKPKDNDEHLPGSDIDDDSDDDSDSMDKPDASAKRVSEAPAATEQEDLALRVFREDQERVTQKSQPSSTRTQTPTVSNRRPSTPSNSARPPRKLKSDAAMFFKKPPKRTKQDLRPSVRSQLQNKANKPDSPQPVNANGKKEADTAKAEEEAQADADRAALQANADRAKAKADAEEAARQRFQFGGNVSPSPIQQPPPPQTSGFVFTLQSGPSWPTVSASAAAPVSSSGLGPASRPQRTNAEIEAEANPNDEWMVEPREE